MNGTNVLAHLIFHITDWLAGAERHDWVAAMAAEGDAMDRGRIGWALGCLCAALEDRVVRERMFIMGLIVLPFLALQAVRPTSLVLRAVAHAIDAPDRTLLPVVLLVPLPFAWLLVRLRPAWAWALVGTLGFATYQTGSSLMLWAFHGTPLSIFWGWDISFYLPQSLAPFGSWIIWMVGAYWGGHASNGLKLESR